MNQQLQDAIDEVMDNFDFEAVHKVMVFLDWKWGQEGNVKEVPSLSDIRRSARRTLKGVIEQGSGFMGTGGFIAYYREDGRLMLYFAVSDWMVEWEVQPQ